MVKPILRTLHVGVGGRGVWPTEICTPNFGFQPVGLCDLDERNLAAARERTGLPPASCFHDVHTMVKAVEADALIVCTPTVTHVRMCLIGFGAGLAVLVEKGMAPDWKSAGKLVEAAGRADVCFCVAQNYRYRPAERTILRAVADPSAFFHLGEVFWADYTEHRVRPEPRSLTYPYASVWDMSCHHFDNMISWFGPAESVVGQAIGASWSAYHFPNNTAALIRFARGPLVAYGHTHDAARSDLRIRLHGRHGALFASVEGVEFSARPAKNFQSRPTRKIRLAGSTGGELGVISAFHRYVTTGLEPGISGRNNLEVMALCQMLVLAIERRRIVFRRELGPCPL